VVDIIYMNKPRCEVVVTYLKHIQILIQRPDLVPADATDIQLFLVLTGTGKPYLCKKCCILYEVPGKLLSSMLIIAHFGRSERQ